ncbi:hypothetical protein Tco_1225029 [Tanacetum coccineum]
MARRLPNWKVVQDVNHKKFLNGGVIMVEDDHDVIHFDNSSDLAFSTNDDLIDDEDVLPHDLANFNDEYLANDDDDDVVIVYSSEEKIDLELCPTNVARGHGGDGGGDDRPPPRQSFIGCQGRGTRKPNRGGKKAGRLNTHGETRNLELRKITDQ